MRFLAEDVGYPPRPWADTIRWSPIDENRATATLAQDGTSVSATFEFSPEGDPRTIRADRYYTREQGATLEKWRIDIEPDSFQVIDGLRIPMKSIVTWELAEGDFEWFSGRDWRPRIRPCRYRCGILIPAGLPPKLWS